MRVILKFIGLSVLVIVPLLLLLQTDFIASKNYYSISYRLKHKIVSEHEDSPKLLITGGSNAAISYNSNPIEESARRPVINLAVNAGFGLRYMLNEIGGVSKAGDILVISPEYMQFFGTEVFDGTILSMLVYTEPSAFRFVDSYDQYLSIYKRFPFTLQQSLIPVFTGQQIDDQMYDTDYFNNHGDIIFEGENKIDDKELYYEISDPLNPAAIDYLNAFVQSAHAQKKACVLVYPAIPEEFYKTNEAKITDLDRRLRTIPHLYIAGTPSSRIHPREEFYDTRYHLRANKYRYQHSQRLVDDLKKFGLID